MFNHIDEKIKMLASVVTRCGIILSVASGIGIMATTDTWIGILVGVFGSIIFWISGFFVYGFGELIEAANEARNTQKELLFILKGSAISAEPSADTAEEAEKENK